MAASRTQGPEHLFCAKDQKRRPRPGRSILGADAAEVHWGVFAGRGMPESCHQVPSRVEGFITFSEASERRCHRAKG